VFDCTPEGLQKYFTTHPRRVLLYYDEFRDCLDGGVAGKYSKTADGDISLLLNGYDQVRGIDVRVVGLCIYLNLRFGSVLE